MSIFLFFISNCPISYFFIKKAISLVSISYFIPYTGCNNDDCVLYVNIPLSVYCTTLLSPLPPPDSTLLAAVLPSTKIVIKLAMSACNALFILDSSSIF